MPLKSRIQRLAAWFLAAGLAATGLVGAPRALAAAPAGNLPDPTWMTNGPVYAMAQLGGTVYLGGAFTEIRQYPPGQGGPFYTVDNLAAVTIDGNPVTSWIPNLNMTGSVLALAVSPDGTKVYVGGNFTGSVDATPLKNLAVVDAVTGTPDATFHPQMGDLVRALLPAPTKLYVGGNFLRIDGKPIRTRLAAFDYAGNLDPDWVPTAGCPSFAIQHYMCTGVVRSLAMSSDGVTVFVGGNFQEVDGATRYGVARVDAVTGALDPWAAQNDNIFTVAFSLVATSRRLFVGVGGPNWVAAYTLTRGAFGKEVWKDHTSGNVQAVTLIGKELVLGGHFLTMDQFRGPTNIPRVRIAAVVADTGAVDMNWDPPVTGQFWGPWALLTSGNHVFVGGNFSNVSGVHQIDFCRFTF